MPTKCTVWGPLLPRLGHLGAKTKSLPTQAFPRISVAKEKEALNPVGSPINPDPFFPVGASPEPCDLGFGVLGLRAWES